jgi:basic amino acid/polyamine antiporter, APA family
MADGSVSLVPDNLMNKSSIFYKKPIEELSNPPFGLKRILGPSDLTFLGVGAVIGAGIFVITGHAAAQYTGPGIVISFILSAIARIFAGLCYAEFSRNGDDSDDRAPFKHLVKIYRMVCHWPIHLFFLYARKTERAWF